MTSPADHFTEASAHASVLREYMTALLAEGFTDHQAMRLLVTLQESLLCGAATITFFGDKGDGSVSEFKPGEKVVSESGSAYTIVFGPYKDTLGADVYLCQDKNGGGIPILASALSAVPPTDPRLDVVLHVLCGTCNMTQRERAGRILTALDAMPKPEVKRYRDSDGDEWTANSDGSYRVSSAVSGDYLGDYMPSFESLRDNYGPLTPLND